LIHFDIDSRYQDELTVGHAITRREGVVFSVVVHVLMIIAIFLVPRLPMFQVSPEELARRREALEQQMREQADQRFVFVQPRVDMKAQTPPERAPLSDADRRAQTLQRPPDAKNPLPFTRGNSPERVEAQNNERARGDQNQNQPTLQPQPETQEARNVPPADDGFRVPQTQTTPQRRPSGSLGEALRNLQQYVQKQTFDNPQGGLNQPGAAIQFDSKGVEFGPWLRRFVAQVRHNWFIPQAAMTFHGHVVVTFNIHKDGTITDVQVLQPSDIEGFNRAAVGAITGSSPTEPLPPEYPTEKALFTVTFYYNEDPDR
jgi:TonB family protein